MKALAAGVGRPSVGAPTLLKNPIYTFLQLSDWATGERESIPLPLTTLEQYRKNRGG